MKILLLNPLHKISINKNYEKYYIRAGSRWPHSGIKRKNTLPHYLPFPFFLAYTAALLIKENFDVDVLDAVALDWSDEKTFDYISSSRPDIILIEVTTPTIEYDLSLSDRIKRELKSIVVFCGAHATVYPWEIIRESKVDYVIKGEYEFTFLALAKLIRDNLNFKDIKGIVYRRNAEVIDAGFSPLIEPLDILPYPARDIFPSKGKGDPTIYWDGFCQLRPALQMHSSRGCPYKCYFCLWPQVMYRNRKYRMFSAKRVVDEMEDLLKRYAVKEIYFDDDDFTVNKKHVLDITKEIKKRNLKLKWSCMGNTITLDEEMISEMASAGCIGIKFGVESANEEILKDLGKPIDLDKVKKIVKLLVKYNIKSHATFTLGLMKENIKSIYDTIKFASELDCDTIQVSIATPYPGTEFFYLVQKKDMLKKDLKWSDFDGKASEIINHEEIVPEEIRYRRKMFGRKWLLSKMFKPKWLFRQFKGVIRGIRYQGFRFYLQKILSALRNELGLYRCE